MKGKNKWNLFYGVLYLITIYSFVYAFLLLATLCSNSDWWTHTYTGTQIQYHEVRWNNSTICTFELPNGDTIRMGDTVLDDAGFDIADFEFYNKNAQEMTVRYTRLWGWFSWHHNLINITANNTTSLCNESALREHYYLIFWVILGTTAPFHLMCIVQFAIQTKPAKRKRKQQKYKKRK